MTGGWYSLLESVPALTVICAGLYWFANVIELKRSEVTAPIPNTDEKVKSILRRLLEEAEKEVLMYDDGDTDEGSLYQDRAIIAALQARLDERPELQVRCMLNNQRGETLFERTFAPDDGRAHPRVRISPRKGRSDRVHYKIVDRKAAYVSRHEEGSNDRVGHEIRVHPVPWRRVPRALSEHIRDFEAHA